jgi:hypothetical protein
MNKVRNKLLAQSALASVFLMPVFGSDIPASTDLGSIPSSNATADFCDLRTLSSSAMVTNAAYAGKLVVMSADTVDTKIVPQLKETYFAVGNKTEFKIAAEESSQAFTNLLPGTAHVGWQVQPRPQIGRKTSSFLPFLLRSKNGFRAFPPKIEI